MCAYFGAIEKEIFLEVSSMGIPVLEVGGLGNYNFSEV